MNLRRLALTTLALTALPVAANASCGSAFCNVNTQWDTQGVWTEPGLRADLRYEYVRQDQPRSGHGKLNIGDVPMHHDEMQSTNQNLVATLDYAFNANWGISASVPFVMRDHSHIHHHHGHTLLETWDFNELGDVRVAGRYQRQWGNFSAVGFWLGAKLPTGQTDIENADGDVAERTLQPGTGTTDLIFGPFVRYPTAHGAWFAQLLVQAPLNSHDEYRAGEQVSLDLGYRHALTEKLSALGQVNWHSKERDHGDEAEPDHSGSWSLSVSPGLSYAITSSAQIYGFVQVPVYQYVNGVQLTEDWSATTGISFKF